MRREAEADGNQQHRLTSAAASWLGGMDLVGKLQQSTS
jgi:hypothetical protein